MMTEKEVNQIKSAIYTVHEIAVLVVVSCWGIWHLIIALSRR
jgi:hypothetical protein